MSAVPTLEPTLSYATIRRTAASKFDKNGHYHKRFPEKFPKSWEQLFCKSFQDGCFYNYFCKSPFVVFCAFFFYSIFHFLYQSSDEENVVERFIEHETPLQRMRHRKNLTYMWRVHSIDTSLDEGNYELMPLLRKEIVLKGKLPILSSKKVKRYCSLTWNLLMYGANLNRMLLQTSQV